MDTSQLLTTVTFTTDNGQQIELKTNGKVTLNTDRNKLILMSDKEMSMEIDKKIHRVDPYEILPFDVMDRQSPLERHLKYSNPLIGAVEEIGPLNLELQMRYEGPHEGPENTMTSQQQSSFPDQQRARNEPFIAAFRQPNGQQVLLETDGNIVMEMSDKGELTVVSDQAMTVRKGNNGASTIGRKQFAIFQVAPRQPQSPSVELTTDDPLLHENYDLAVSHPPITDLLSYRPQRHQQTGRPPAQSAQQPQRTGRPPTQPAQQTGRPPTQLAQQPQQTGRPPTQLAQSAQPIPWAPPFPTACHHHRNHRSPLSKPTFLEKLKEIASKLKPSSNVISNRCHRHR